jgi:hypothetical protein
MRRALSGLLVAVLPGRGIVETVSTAVNLLE